MDAARQARTVADRVETLFYDRCPPFKRPQHLRPPAQRTARPANAPVPEPVLEKLREHMSGAATPVAEAVEPDKVADDALKGKKIYDLSLLWTLNRGAGPLARVLFGEVTRRWQHSSGASGPAVSSSCSETRSTRPRVRLPRLSQSFPSCHVALVTKLLIQYITTAYVFNRAPTGTVAAPRSPGYGIALAFGIFLMQETSSLCTNQVSRPP